MLPARASVSLLDPVRPKHRTRCGVIGNRREQARCERTTHEHDTPGFPTAVGERPFGRLSSPFLVKHERVFGVPLRLDTATFAIERRFVVDMGLLRVGATMPETIVLVRLFLQRFVAPSLSDERLDRGDVMTRDLPRERSSLVSTRDCGRYRRMRSFRRHRVVRDDVV